jgi:CheY-like chemotaxis protein
MTDETGVEQRSVDPLAQHRAKKWCVLVIDDEEIDRLIIQRHLRALGHEAITAKDGADGLEAAQKVRPHVILIDIHIPRQNGYEICEEIRRLPWGKQAAIYAMTGFNNLEDFERALRVGFDGFLTKPLNSDTLARLLR